MPLDPTINFGKVQVSTGYNSAATSVVLTTGEAARVGMPDPATAGAFNVWWWNDTDYPDPADDPNRELVRVTARSTDTLTVTRAQEGTSASNKNTGGKTYKMGMGVTKKTVDDINARSAGFISFGAASSTPTDGATIHMGHPLVAPSTSDSHDIYVEKACTIVGLSMNTALTAGSNETWPFYIRVNNTTDYFVANLDASASKIINVSGLNIPLAAGDFFTIKAVNPTWTTNPTNVRPSGRVRIIE